MSKDIYQDAVIHPERIVEAMNFADEATTEALPKIREQHNLVLQYLSDDLGESAKAGIRIRYPDMFRDDIVFGEDTRVVIHTRREVYEGHTRFVTAASLHMDGEVKDLKCAAFNVKNGAKEK